MKTTVIYGASDDLIEMEGEIEDELGYGKNSATITCSDGTIAKISYIGVWKIEIKKEGTKFIKLIPWIGDDGKHESPELKDFNCPSYSDVLILGKGIEWIKIGKRTFK